MTTKRHDPLQARLSLLWRGPAVAVLCLAAAGCGSTARLTPGPVQPPQTAPFSLGSRAEQNELREEVAEDSFPTAAEAGMPQ